MADDSGVKTGLLMAAVGVISFVLGVAITYGNMKSPPDIKATIAEIHGSGTFRIEARVEDYKIYYRIDVVEGSVQMEPQ